MTPTCELWAPTVCATGFEQGGGGREIAIFAPIKGFRILQILELKSI